MKRQLSATTALVAVGLLAGSGTALAQQASSPKITVGGYAEHGLEWIDNGDAVGGKNTGGIASFYDTEIHFKMGAQLDNGIKIDGRVELEANNLAAGESGTVSDETWLRFSGSFGQVIMGGRDNAAMLMVTGYQGSWATGVAHNMAFDRPEIVPQPAGFTLAGPAFGVREDLSDADDPKITYVSPRIGGFQIGASYAKDTGRVDPDAPVDQSATGAGYEDFMAIAANFDQKFGDFRVGVAVGYLQDKPNTTTTQAQGTDDTRKAYVAGVSLETGPFKVSVGYNNNDDPAVVSTGSTDGDAWDIGARYRMGPNAFSIAYSTASVKGSTATPGDDEVDDVWVSYSRTLGPGVAWRTSAGWVDWKGEGSAGGAADNDGYGLMTSLRVNF